MVSQAKTPHPRPLSPVYRGEGRSLCDSHSVVSVVLAARLLQGMLTLAVEVAQPPFGVLLLGRVHFPAPLLSSRLECSVARPSARLVAGRHWAAMLLLVCHDS